jgi:hypothetical protein
MAKAAGLPGKDERRKLAKEILRRSLALQPQNVQDRKRALLAGAILSRSAP